MHFVPPNDYYGSNVNISGLLLLLLLFLLLLLLIIPHSTHKDGKVLMVR
jgi:hypothetical protein